MCLPNPTIRVRRSSNKRPERSDQAPHVRGPISEARFFAAVDVISSQDPKLFERELSIRRLHADGLKPFPLSPLYRKNPSRRRYYAREGNSRPGPLWETVRICSDVVTHQSATRIVLQSLVQLTRLVCISGSERRAARPKKGGAVGSQAID